MFFAKEAVIPRIKARIVRKSPVILNSVPIFIRSKYSGKYLDFISSVKNSGLIR